MILVFAGAGASKALNPQHYPTTVEFFEGLPEAVTEAPLFQRVRQFLGGENTEVPLDIEQVLWAIGEWQEFHRLNSDVRAFPAWLIAKNRIRMVLGEGDRFDGRSAVAKYKEVNAAALDVQSSINQLVYSLYRRLPTEAEIDEAWAPLLGKALEIDPRLDVFTTNYDLVLESVVEHRGFPIETGRTQTVTPRLSVKLWDEARVDASIRKTGLLTKLHGSLDWIRGDEEDEIFVGTPQFTGEHQRHAIIYPGFKGMPNRTPFTYFHDYLRSAAEHAAAAIFVGFAFRDDVIREIVRDRFGSGIPIVVIGLGGQPPQIPFRKGQYKYLGDGFSRKAVDLALNWVEKALS